MSQARLTATRRALRRASGPTRLRFALHAGALLALPAAADAQLAVNRMELVLHPHVAAERAGVVTVRNEGTTPVQATVRLEDWDRAEDGTNRWYPMGTVSGSCRNVLKAFPLALSLAPGAEQSVRVGLDSTATLPGECWSGLIFETVQRDPRARSAANMIIRTAVKLYVEPPTIVADGAIAEMRVVDRRPKAASTPDSAATLEVVFANTGTRRIESSGTLEIRRPDNSVVGKVAMPTLYTLPGARRRFRVAIPTLMPGRYILLGMVDYGGDDIAAAQIEYEAP